MKTVETEVGAVLAGTISAITQRSIFNRLGGLAARPIQQLTPQDRLAIMAELESSVRLFARRNSAELIASCAQALAGVTAGIGAGSAASQAAAAAADAVGNTKRLAIDQEKDIATARLEAWSEAVRIGLSKFTSVKVATAVSELARNIIFYGGKGFVELKSTKDDRGPTLQIVASDKGPGIEPRKLDEIWAGTYKSQRGMGKGLVAVKKLVDDFHLDTGPGRGTTVTCLFRGER
ncbi:MAG: serine/threonine-protein kinase RsbT [Acidobacteriota bacterium]|jgi:serine/threonine-protein kinase RsbT|nr:serine/threonine-protein kinase RsbT [Acidobacteriota bacterium]